MLEPDLKESQEQVWYNTWNNWQNNYLQNNDTVNVTKHMKHFETLEFYENNLRISG